MSSLGLSPNPVPGAVSGRRMAGAQNFEAKKLWTKAKLLVLQKVSQETHMKGVKQLVDAAVRANSLIAMENAEHRRRTKKRQYNPDLPGEEQIMTSEHLRLLYLIRRYTDDENGTKWLRSIPLSVLVYEGVVAEVFDWDYAPVTIVVSGLRATVNLSQEGRSAVDELREHGMLYGLKLSSKNYQYTNAMQISSLGRQFLGKHLTNQDMMLVDELIEPPSVDDHPGALKEVVWDPTSREWRLVHNASGYSVVSSFTDVESVSYISSPFICNSALKGSLSCSDNSDRVGEMQSAKSNIRDAELSEAISVGDVHLLIGEWVPLGPNGMMMLNESLGSNDRVQGGFFSKDYDEAPEETVWQGNADGLTQVNILDWDETSYVNYEAEVHFKGRSPGIVQVENFGVHVHESGQVCYGLRLDAVMDRVGEGISLDLLSRVLVETVKDSSTVAENLLTAKQRDMLNLTFLNDAATRQKFTVLLCESIKPKKLAVEYLDHGELENEMKQVLGDVTGSYDLSETEVLVVGQQGLLCAGSGALRHEETLLMYSGLMARNVFMRTLFRRTFILNDDMARVRQLIRTHDADPQAVVVVRQLLGRISEDIGNLGNIVVYLQESLATVGSVDDSAMAGGSKKVAAVLQLRELHDKMGRRTRDIEQLIEIARHDLQQLTSMAEDIQADEQFRVSEEVQRNTKHLTEVGRASERTTATLELMQIVLAGTLAFAMVDRVSGLYLGIAADISWAIELFDPMLQTPGAWLSVNVGWWLVLAVLLLKCMKRISRRHNGDVSVNITLNRPMDVDKWHAFLMKRAIVSEHGDSDLSSSVSVKKYGWVERKARKWQGKPPQVEVTVDEEHCFLLRVTLIANRHRSKVGTQQLQALFVATLEEAGVLMKPGATPIARVDAEDAEELLVQKIGV
eukprot:COSAG01_NODE_260_length_20041_cov_15.896249_1_plen_908_part_00